MDVSEGSGCVYEDLRLRFQKYPFLRLLGSGLRGQQLRVKGLGGLGFMALGLRSVASCRGFPAYSCHGHPTPPKLKP